MYYNTNYLFIIDLTVYLKKPKIEMSESNMLKNREIILELNQRTFPSLLNEYNIDELLAILGSEKNVLNFFYYFVSKIDFCLEFLKELEDRINRSKTYINVIDKF